MSAQLRCLANLFYLQIIQSSVQLNLGWRKQEIFFLIEEFHAFFSQHFIPQKVMLDKLSFICFENQALSTCLESDQCFSLKSCFSHLSVLVINTSLLSQYSPKFSVSLNIIRALLLMHLLNRRFSTDLSTCVQGV